LLLRAPEYNVIEGDLLWNYLCKLTLRITCHVAARRRPQLDLPRLCCRARHPTGNLAARCRTRHSTARLTLRRRASLPPTRSRTSATSRAVVVNLRHRIDLVPDRKPRSPTESTPHYLAARPLPSSEPSCPRTLVLRRQAGRSPSTSATEISMEP
jgi:hypothetical protein